MVNEVEDTVEVVEDVDCGLGDLTEAFELASERLSELSDLLTSLKETVSRDGYGQRDLVLLGRMLVDGVPKTAYEFMELEREVDSMWYSNTKRN